MLLRVLLRIASLHMTHSLVPCSLPNVVNIFFPDLGLTCELLQHVVTIDLHELRDTFLRQALQ